ncbi:MAG TPA: HprK-related kinase A [Thiobacillus sp.]|nr:MAG: HprK-related kinase A [Hydrogenophilales bacterium 16-64-40]OZA35638.1 MAG: HprK-related kinase A [Hydrogenophilales bacterium 17-64-65]HQS83157.1 HprK-related kinase A [Thiobacillus sp.]HQT34081.1 HprK-related kinase A [Thiobacillus sp.]
MKLLQLPRPELRRQLAGAGIWLRTGPFSLRLRSRFPAVAEGLAELYGQFEVRNAHEAFTDFHVSVNPPATLRRWLRPQAAFSFDGMQPFKPLPRDQAFPMLEWGLNWCVSTQAHQYLIIHAAVVEKNGLAAILPAPPGSGKSTLAAGLVLSGWRLLSDELTLIDRKTGLIQPLPRPVSLKNKSIDVIRQFAPDVHINRASHDTVKGTVAHMRPPRDSVRRQHETARPGWVIFPKWEAGAAATLTPRSRAQTFMFLAQNAFNYSHLGADGFRVGTTLIDQADCYDFHYSALDEAIATFDRLAEHRTS